MLIIRSNEIWIGFVITIALLGSAGCERSTNKMVVQTNTVSETIKSSPKINLINTDPYAAYKMPNDADIVVEIVGWERLDLVKPSRDVKVEFVQIDSGLDALLSGYLGDKNSINFIVPSEQYLLQNGKIGDEIILKAHDWAADNGFKVCKFYSRYHNLYNQVYGDGLPSSEEVVKKKAFLSKPR